MLMMRHILGSALSRVRSAFKTTKSPAEYAILLIASPFHGSQKYKRPGFNPTFPVSQIIAASTSVVSMMMNDN